MTKFALAYFVDSAYSPNPERQSVKLHLLETDTPITQGATIKVNCGEEIPNAVPVFMWDADSTTAFGVSLTLGKFCRKCVSGVDSLFPENGRYAYGIVSGQEMIDGESAKQGARSESD